MFDYIINKNLNQVGESPKNIKKKLILARTTSRKGLKKRSRGGFRAFCDRNIVAQNIANNPQFFVGQMFSAQLAGKI